ncbi:2-oxoglutarate dehydrogenase complex dihydrolipoyllysine-residue succinyltransferase [Microscilla marina]|uniref:Dihydrolipoyllysine-residue succinyltransferase component of 2-oxoglutarate dehydrogenase complex n=1 Tax=Microscilla marina ATCC 23134 TaxID=313606 RepID=A1ZGF8_MICM2|nr:2-oxoglutarate dehydrogenase complex dihydrolipoyllysine-residue succinyltransferase [Microscilla marina]EAY30575.1 2-oxoglutarate dehydrogenase, E2 component, dihydrolipoamide succinyltransferase [Microscilla marina ATCC 23134]
MAVEMKIPDLAESITEVVISQWLKQDGDYVELDEMICEVETDKAAQELAAESAGILRIMVPEGETVNVGDVICRIEASENGSSAGSSKTAANASDNTATKIATTTDAPTTTGKEVEMRVPELAESITEVMIGAWLKEDGDFVTLDEPICEVETDKAAQELPAEATGILQMVAKEGETLNVGDLICTIKVTEAPVSNGTASKPSSDAGANNIETSSAAGHPSPAASKILAEKGIDPADVKGTGVGGRITKEDAMNAQKKKPKAEAPAQNKKETAAPKATVSAPAPGSRNQNRKRMSPLRKTVARRLVSVKNETAMLTTFNEVNMQPIKDLRAKYKEQFKEKYGVGLGFMGFFVKACCAALTEIPGVNAMIDGNEIVYNEFCDISVAVSAPKGLVVPVLRNAESLSFQGIEQGIKDLALKARDNKLSIEEMQGGTFTITNGGVFGSMLSTPIINAPQSAILGMHNIVDRPMAVNGEVKILPIMYLALSYDHRIIDGREAVTFLVRLKQLLEEPERLMFGV